MSAKIEILSGISGGNRVWLQKKVIRLGSDPQSDICIPSAELPPVAMTLEFRDGDWRIHDRSGLGIRVQGADSLTKGTSIWQNGATIVLADGTELRLIIDGDAAPSLLPIPDVNATEGGQSGGTDGHVTGARRGAKADPRKDNGSKWGAWAVTALCLAGCAGLLLWQGRGVDTKSSALSFSAIIDESLKSENTSHDLVQRLQYAQAAFGRGDHEVAREWFARLRDDLLKQDDRLSREGKDTEIKILRFAEYQLGKLAK
jgi:hypothetical protein